jgi:hypothetical protein
MSEPTLDDLYWNTDLATAAVAARCGVPAHRLHTRVAPLDAGLACYRCGTSLTYTSRSQRDSARPRCQQCGCSRSDPARARAEPDHPWRAAPTVVGGVVVVRDDGRRDIGWMVESCAGVLREAGVTWGGELVLIDASSTDTGGDVLRALAGCEPGVLALSSLCELGSSQSERLQVLFALTRMRWRVATATSIHVSPPHRPLTAHDLDDLEDEAPSPYELSLVSRLLSATSGRGAGWSGW